MQPRHRDGPPRRVRCAAVARHLRVHPRLPPVEAEACTPAPLGEGSSPASSMGWVFSAVEAVCTSSAAQVWLATASPMVRRTPLDLAAAAARSETRLRARPTSSKDEPSLADGIDRSSDPSPLFLTCGRSGDSGRSDDSGLSGVSGRSGGKNWLQLQFRVASSYSRSGGSPWLQF